MREMALRLEPGVPPANQTWQCHIHHLWIILPSKPLRGFLFAKDSWDD